MGIRATYRKSWYGERLMALEETGRSAIAELQGLTATLPALRTQIEADPDLSADEKLAAVAEVNTTIVELVTAVKAFADSL